MTEVVDNTSPLPVDRDAVLVGRMWESDVGPSPIVVRDGEVVDISAEHPTVSALCEQQDPAGAALAATGRTVGTLDDLLVNTDPAQRDPRKPWLLAPIEERAGGDLTIAKQIRDQIALDVGRGIEDIVPGSDEAAALKSALVDRGVWSQYLEVGIGPDAEIFTKGQVLSAVGTCVPVGVLRSSTWNNPEPEVALVITSSGRVVGATLANDVNLRDVEGRSALLLPRAKDNNASCAIGPLIRLFHGDFGLAQVRTAVVTLDVRGADGFRLVAESRMSLITRDPLDLVAQLIGDHHQYPDGAILLLGTMFAPTEDRGAAGMGFTHQVGDTVRISSPQLGALVNTVLTSEDCEPFTFGVGALMRNLAARGLL
jgi:fumarylacetoacetate (FAA) hydrolase family protein